MANYSAGSASITVKPSFANFKTEAEAKLKGMDLGPILVRVELDTRAAETKIKALRANASRDLRTRLELDTRAAATKVAALRREAARNVSGMKVNVDTRAARTEVAALRRLASNNVSGMRVDVDVARAMAEIEALRRAAGQSIPVPIEPEADEQDVENKVKKVHSSLGRKLKRQLKWAAIYNLSVVGVIGAASVLADLAAITNAAAQAAHTVALIPAISFGGLVGLGSLAAGISGIPAVFKARSAATKDATNSAEKYSEALAAVSEAEYQVGQAQIGVQDADRAARASQVSLTEAYKAAGRSIRDMNADLADTKLSVEDAALSVQEAAQRLNEVRFDPTANATERARAELSYRQALQRLTEQQNKLQDQQADTAIANAKGVGGSKLVVDAKQDVVDATRGEVSAQHDLTSAYESLRKAQYELAHPGGSGGSQSALDAALAKLSPNARQLVDDIFKIGPAWTEARKAAQDALTQGIGPAVTKLAAVQLPSLSKAMVEVNRGFNSGFKDVLAELSTPKNQADFKTSLDNTAKGFANAAGAAKPLTAALTQLITTGSAFLPQFGTALANAATKFHDFIRISEASGALQQYMQSGIDATARLVEILGHLGSSIASVFRAASAGGPTLQSVEELTGRMAAFLKSVDGQSGMKNFWAEARAGAEALKPVFKDIPAILHNVWEGIRDWSAILLPFLKFAAGLLSGHVTLVKAMVIGWLAWKTLAPLATIAAAGIARATTAVGRFSSAMGGAGGGIRGFGRGLSSLSSLVGGPWGLAMIAATVAVIGITSEMHKAKDQTDTLAQSGRDLAINQRELAKQFQATDGEVSTEMLSTLENQIDGVIASTERLADSKPGAFSVFTGGFGDIKGWFSGQAEAGTDAVRKAEELAGANTAARDTFRELGQSSSEMVREIYGSNAAFDSYIDKLHGTANGGQEAETRVRELRKSFLDARQTAKDTTPGFFGLIDAVAILADKTKSATDRLGAMRTALDILSGKPVDAQKALADYNEKIREAIDFAKEFDQAGAKGKDLIAFGQVDTETVNGKKLFDQLLEIRDATLAAGVAGNDLGPRFAKNAETFKTIGDAVGLTAEQVRGLAEKLGYLPEDIKILTSLQGADDATQQLVVISELLERNKRGVVVPVTALNKDAKDKLKEIGALEEVVGHPELIRLVAKSDEALAEIKKVVDAKIPDKNMRVQVEWDFEHLDLQSEAVRALNTDIANTEKRLTRADGGEINGGVPGRDSVPALLMPGEHVLTTDDVDAMGGQARVYQWRAGLHHYAEGGAVPDPFQDSAIVTSMAQAVAARYPGMQLTSGLRFTDDGYHSVGKAADFSDGDTDTPGMQSLSSWIAANYPQSLELIHANFAHNIKDGRDVGAGPPVYDAKTMSEHISHVHWAISAPISALPGTGPGTSTGNAATLGTQSQLYPQAPLPGRATEEQLSALTGRAAVDSANSERNAVYGNPASTAQDRLAADIKYQQAQNALEAQDKKDTSSLSLQGIFSKAGGILAEGILSGLGLENSIFSESNVYNKSASTLYDRFGQKPGGGGGYAYQPKNLPSVGTTSTPNSAADANNPYLAGTIPGSGPITGLADPFGPTNLGTITVSIPGSTTGTGKTGPMIDRVRGIMADLGWHTGAQWNALDQLVEHESGWNPNAQNPTSTAYGLFQFLDTTWASVGGVKTSDAGLQALYGRKYIQQRYGDPVHAWAFWQAQSPHWYADGGWVGGAGGSRSDSVHARVSPGEYVVNAYDAARNGPVLEAINSSSWSPVRLDANTMTAPNSGNAGGHNFSTTIVEPRVADVGDLVALAERAAQTKAIGLMAAMR